jgi:hypothetical protein
MVQVMKLLIKHFSLASSSFLGQNILLSSLFSKILSLYSSLNVRDQDSHPHYITGNIKISIFQSLCFLTADEKTSGYELNGSTNLACLNLIFS